MMKRYNLFFVFMFCCFCVPLSAQTVNSATIQEEVTVFKKANPDNQRTNDPIDPNTKTVEKSRNPKNPENTGPADDEKIIISEQRSRNPGSAPK